MEQVRFDDVDGINALAGEVGAWGEAVEVTPEMVDRFAALTGDHRHRFLVVALIPPMAPPGLERIVGYSSAPNYGAERVRFLAPVPAGSALRARCQVLRAERRPKGTLVTFEIEVGVVGSEEPALLYALQLLYMGTGQERGEGACGPSA
ncbi:MAG TPA: hypothetical protein VHB02_04450 [Acidimicrobiales bacterium]|nr:hypothetical protein [Acidimicrobiales bacterium]